jgi:hypothetical protein
MAPKRTWRSNVNYEEGLARARAIDYEWLVKSVLFVFESWEHAGYRVVRNESGGFGVYPEDGHPLSTMGRLEDWQRFQGYMREWAPAGVWCWENADPEGNDQEVEAFGALCEAYDRFTDDDIVL